MLFSRWYLQAFAQLGEEFEPMMIGCEENRRNWRILAEGRTPPEDDVKPHRDEDDGSTTNQLEGSATSVEIYV